MSEETEKSADPNWEKRCRETLEECIKNPDLGAKEWSIRRQALDSERNASESDLARKRVRLVCIDLSNKDLEGYGFPFCYLIGVNFKGANLRNTRFDKTVIDDGNFDEADISGANFLLAHIIGRTFLTPKYWSHPVNLNTLSLSPTVIASEFLRREVTQQRLFAGWDQQPAGRLKKFWYRNTRYGTKAGKLVAKACAAEFSELGTLAPTPCGQIHLSYRRASSLE